MTTTTTTTTEKPKPRWTWDKSLPGTLLFPHHRRWDCRQAMLGALRQRDYPKVASWHIGRASAFNAIMFDCNDPLARRYAVRIEKIRKLLDVS